MSQDKKRLKQAIDGILSGLGFNRKGTAWYLTSPEIIGVIDLQKSDDANHFYMNVGFFIRTLDVKVENPPERLCHLRYRVERLFPEVAGRTIVQMLSLDLDENAEARELDLQRFLREKVGPFVASLGTVDALRKQRTNEWFPMGFIHFAARELLEKATG